MSLQAALNKRAKENEGIKPHKRSRTAFGDITNVRTFFFVLISFYKSIFKLHVLMLAEREYSCHPTKQQRSDSLEENVAKGKVAA